MFISWSRNIRPLLALAPVFAAALLMGWWAGTNRADQVDSELRQSLATQTVELASIINPRLATHTTLSERDKHCPACLVLREQLTIHERNSLPRYDLDSESLAIYSLLLRENKVFFGPDSVEKDDYTSTRSGLAYENPPEGLLDLFYHQAPYLVTGPYSDEFGSHVSAFAPVVDDRTGSVSMVVALTIDADDWVSILRSARTSPLVMMIAALVLVSILILVVYYYLRLPGMDRALNLKAWIFMPATLTALCLFLFYGIYEYRSTVENTRHQMFSRTLQVRDGLHRLVASEVRFLRAQVDSVAELEPLRNAWMNNRFTELQGIASILYNSLHQDYGIIHFNILDADRRVILRNRYPELSGDEIDRYTLFTAERTGEDSWGIEINRWGDLSIRYVRPWIISGRTIGYLEMGTDMGNLTARISSLMNIDGVVTALRKEHIDRPSYRSWREQTNLPDRWEEYPSHIILHGFPDVLSPSLSQWLHESDHPPRAIGVFEAREEKTRLSFGVFHLADAGGRTVADVVLIRDVSALLKEQWGAMTSTLALALVFICGGLFILWLVASRVEKQLAGAFSRLSESEERWKFALEGAGDGVWDWNMQDDRVHYSRQWKALLGFDDHEISDSPKEWQSRIHPQDRRHVYESIAEHFVNDSPTYFDEYRLLCKDGTYKWLLARGKVVRRAEGGEPIRAIGTHTDITDHRTMEEELRESRDHYRLLFESVSDAVIILDEDAFIVDFNHHALALLGFERPEELLGTRPWELGGPQQSDGRDSQTVALAEIEAARQGQKRSFEWLYYRKDGTRAVAEVRLTAFDQYGETYLLSMVRDITEEKTLAERLQRAEKMESLGMLAGGIAHDLNNILGVLSGYSELMLLKLKEHDPLRRFAENIKSAAERSGLIVQDMLTLARRGVQTAEVVSMNHIIRNCLDSPELQQYLSATPGISIEVALSDDLPLIEGSPAHVHKALLNLIINAAEAMPEGGLISIRTESGRLNPDHAFEKETLGTTDRYVLVHVSDTGQGISEEDRKRIFEPFYSKKVMGRSGTGLGLSVVWGVVNDHGGFIEVDSRKGEGSTFTLFFPVSDKSMADEILQDPRRHLGKGEMVLVVDDMEEQRTMARQILENLGYRVDTASGGEEALERLKKEAFDLVVLDMIMEPGMDGLDTYREIIALRPGQKAIIVSGFAETERVKQTRSLGAGGYLKKPYTIEGLSLAVRTELDRQ